VMSEREKREVRLAGPVEARRAHQGDGVQGRKPGAGGTRPRAFGGGSGREARKVLQTVRGPLRCQPSAAWAVQGKPAARER
jgi:hypothetical protein